MNDISEPRLAELAALPENDVDLSDIPELSDAFFKTAMLVMPTIPLQPDA